LTPDEWYHLVITQKGDETSEVYLNAEKVATGQRLGRLDREIYIGGLPLNSSGAIIAVDDIVRYRGVVSEAYIASSYAHPRCGYRINENVYNARPYANAGKYQRAVGTDAIVKLSGEASDDVAVISTTWSQVSGPANADISNANSLNPTLNLADTGVYIFELAVDDGEFVSKSQTEVIVSNNLCKLHIDKVNQYWSFNGHIDDYYSGNDSEEEAQEIKYATGKEHQALTFTGSERILLEKKFLTTLNQSNQAFSIEFWIKYDGVNGRLMEWAGGSSIDVLNSRVTLNYRDSNGTLRSYFLNNNFDNQQWNHVVLNIKENSIQGLQVVFKDKLMNLLYMKKSSMILK